MYVSGSSGQEVVALYRFEIESSDFTGGYFEIKVQVRLVWLFSPFLFIRGGH